MTNQTNTLRTRPEEAWERVTAWRALAYTFLATTVIAAILWIHSATLVGELLHEREQHCVAIEIGERAISQRHADGSVTCVRHVNHWRGMVR